MKKFEFLEHTADAKFLAYGKNLEEAFSNAAAALFTIMTDITKIKPKIKKHIVVNSSGKQAMLYDFLEELIFLMDTEAFLLHEVKNLKITGSTLDADAYGDKGDGYDVHTQVKAITYNDMFIKEEEDLVTVQVVPDL